LSVEQEHFVIESESNVTVTDFILSYLSFSKFNLNCAYFSLIM